jgi:hypothetical protein
MYREAGLDAETIADRIRELAPAEGAAQRRSSVG